MTKTQFTKFAVAGTIFTVFNIAVLYALTDVLGIYYILSSIIAFILGSTGNFLLNKKWTFQEKMRHDLLKKYIKAMSVNISSVIITITLLFVLTEFLNIYYLISQTIAMIVAFFANYIGNKKIVFVPQQP